MPPSPLQEWGGEGGLFPCAQHPASPAGAAPMPSPGRAAHSSQRSREAPAVPAPGAATVLPKPHSDACPTRGWQVAEGSVWLLLSPWGAGTCPCATELLCRKMLLAFSATWFF